MAPSNGNGNGGVWDKTTPLHFVAQVIRKLQDGTYPTEPTKCFCGCESNDTVITERDRYTLPHRMVMCENCLLIRANPRMTKEAYAEFYNNEYRQIYDGFPYQEKSEDDDFLFQIAADKGIQLKTFLSELDVKPKTIIDIGSDKGGTLAPFKEDGATAWGVEICEHGRSYAAKRGIPTVASVEELIEKGVKADLIIMQDMIEHLMDLSEIGKLKDLLAPKTGRLFIYTPGLLAIDPNMAFQNAHTFQFIAATLEYVMREFGYVSEMLDDRIISLWRHVGPGVVLLERPLEWRKYILEHLAQKELRSLPPVRTRCKFSEQEMLSNLEANLSRHVPMMSELIGKSSGPCVIVGGGPSVDGQIDKIKELAGRGYPVFVIERMYPWCYEHGIKPAFVVQLDASDGVEEGFVHIDPDAVHLICATTNPKVFEILNGCKKYIFTGIGGSYPDAQAIWASNGYRKVTVVNTGGSVALSSMSIATMLGFRNLHLFGFDFMVPNLEKTYAAGIAGESVDRAYMEVEVGEKHEIVLTCTSFLAFAQQFFNMVETQRKWGMTDSVDIYGESLINKMWDRPKSEAIWQSQVAMG